jgi:hypothetical protein
MKVIKLTPPEGNDENMPFITVHRAVGGWTSVMLYYDPECEFWEPWQTGILYFKTREEAVKDAKDWAEAEGFSYCDNIPDPMMPNGTGVKTNDKIDEDDLPF